LAAMMSRVLEKTLMMAVPGEIVGRAKAAAEQ
jgi:hypothetical protein